MMIFKRCLIFLTIIFACPSFAAKTDNHVYKLSDTDTLKITQVFLGPYWIEYEITRQKIIANKSIDVPLRMDWFSDDLAKFKSAEEGEKGVRFAADDDPSFDTETSRLSFSHKNGYVATYGYDYQLVDNNFKLLKVTKSESVHCDEKTNACDTKETIIFTAGDKNAPSH